MHRNLILSVVGDESVHPTWLAGSAERNFDLALVYFGRTPGRYADQAVWYVARKGVKFALLAELARGELAETLQQYDRVWIPDDDVAGDVATVNRLFDVAAEYKLAICQPGIGRGDMSYQELRADSRFVLRYTGFVEIMCPLFSRRALEKVLPLFDANRSGWGIDWVWSSWFDQREVAVIDAAPMAHTRPLRAGGVHKQLAAQGIDPFAEHEALMKAHGLDIHDLHRSMVRGTARLRGVTPDGKEVWTRPLWHRLIPRPLRRKAA
jgi:hypothetical protein